MAEPVNSTFTVLVYALRDKINGVMWNVQWKPGKKIKKSLVVEWIATNMANVNTSILMITLNSCGLNMSIKIGF